MTTPTYTQPYTQQQSPHLFGQTPGFDPFNTGYGNTGYGNTGYGQQWNQQFGQQLGQQWNQQLGQQFGQQGGDVQTLVWQLLGYAQQSIQLAQQIVMHSLQQQPQYQMNQNQWQNPFLPRGFQRQPMAW